MRVYSAHTEDSRQVHDSTVMIEFGITARSVLPEPSVMLAHGERNERDGNDVVM